MELDLNLDFISWCCWNNVHKYAVSDTRCKWDKKLSAYFWGLCKIKFHKTSQLNDFFNFLPNSNLTNQMAAFSIFEEKNWEQTQFEMFYETEAKYIVQQYVQIFYNKSFYWHLKKLTKFCWPLTKTPCSEVWSFPLLSFDLYIWHTHQGINSDC